ncbi:uncharacterized protein [Cebidichthys violaceus]|uniref:uncharacterized protein n=1 Tax=Cebidichthys violaceus TaxID=271503 RepID=UPI0035C94529
MACGVHLGILLICLVQAELVRSLWAARDQRQNGNTHVGFSQQGGRFGGNDLQNQLRQASGPLQPVKPAKSGYASVMLAQSGSESKPNRPTTKSNQDNVQKMPKKHIFGLSVASGSSLSKYHQTPISKKRTQQGTPSTGNYQSSSSGSLQSPRGGHSFKAAAHQSAAQKASAVSKTPGRGYPKSMRSPSLSSDGAAGPQRIPARTKTSASGPAVKVSSHRGSAASKPSYFSSLQNERTRNKPSRTGNPTPNKLVPVNVGSLPDSGTSGQRFAPTRTYKIPQLFGGYAIRRLKEPTDQKEVSVGKPKQAYVAPQQTPAQKQTYVAPQQTPAQKQTYVAPQQTPAQKQTYVAPQQTPAQKQAYVASQRTPAQKQSYVAPQRTPAQKQTYVAPQQTPAQKQSYVAPQQTPAQKQTYVAPQQTPAQKQTYVTPQRPPAPKQTYVTPQRPPAPKQTYVTPQRPPAPKQTYVAPQRPPAPKQSYVAPQRTPAPKQSYMAPQRTPAPYKPQAQSVLSKAKWMRIKSGLRQ